MRLPAGLSLVSFDVGYRDRQLNPESDQNGFSLPGLCGQVRVELESGYEKF